MKELEDLVRGWRALPPGTPTILATVVRTRGSTYRKAGAKMLLTQTGWIAGSVSGGCLESDLIQTAWRKTEAGPALLTYDATAEEDVLWGFGLGCNGVVEVFLERVDSTGGPMAFLADRFERRESGLMTTILDPGPRFGEHAYFEGRSLDAPEAEVRVIDGVETFLDPVESPFELTICGAGHDAGPLVGMAKLLGWHVTVVDRRPLESWADRLLAADVLLSWPGGSSEAPFPISEGSALVLMTHNYLQDRELLRLALGSPAAYIGVIGPKVRSDRLLRDLRDDGVTPSAEQLHRLHAPIGLDLGAESPDEIALCIVAEIQAFLRQRTPASLRASNQPLHRRSQHREAAEECSRLA